MEGMGLKLTPVVVRCVLCPLSMSGPMADTSWTHSYIVHPIPLTCPPLIYVAIVITLQ